MNQIEKVEKASSLLMKIYREWKSAFTKNDERGRKVAAMAMAKVVADLLPDGAKCSFDGDIAEDVITLRSKEDLTDRRFQAVFRDLPKLLKQGKEDDDLYARDKGENFIQLVDVNEIRVYVNPHLV